MTSRQPVTNFDRIIKKEAYAWLMKFPQGVYDVEDLIQEGEIVAWRAQQLFDPRRSSAAFDTYLTTGLRNRYKNMVHKSWTTQDGEDEIYTQHPDVVGEESASVDVRLSLEKCSPQERKVVEALFKTDGDLRKAATQLGMTVELVDRYRQRAKKRIGIDG
jgi:RNA polymerase sigma factor (sigma-70 family)